MRTSWWVQVLARSYSKASTHVSKPARLNTSFSCRSEISRSCCCLFALKFRFRNIYWPTGSTELSQRCCIYHQTDKTSWWESGVTADKLGEGADSRRQEWLLSAGVSLVGALRPFWDEMINLFICLFISLQDSQSLWHAGIFQNWMQLKAIKHTKLPPVQNRRHCWWCSSSSSRRVSRSHQRLKPP